MPDSEERPAKRVRADTFTASNRDLHSDSEDQVTRDEEFWLVDGNIVLVSGKVGFKVYMGLLAEQSAIFSNVFSSSRSDPSQLLDHVPVVHFSDSLQDLRHLLRALLPNKQR